MRRRVMVALAMTSVLAATAGQAQTLTGTLKKVRDSGTLTVGYRENALPFSYTGSDGKPAGYSIDLCQEIAVAVQQELKLPNLTVRWVPVTPENRLDAVANGTVDIECGSTTASLSRHEKVDFTLLTFVDGASLLIAEGSGIRTVADLAGKRVGVVPGTTTEKVVADFLRGQSLAATVVPVKDHDEGLAALQTSKIEAYASDRVILVGLVLQARGTSRYALISDDLSYEPYAFMVRRDDSAFRLVANRALARTYRSGAIGAIYSKWFGALGKPSQALVLMYALQGLPE
ncbi:MAG TPA: amino acid ABC transporter substrate-binding protein [Methylomirabilota bacterium]|jgi:glutamate/aspartate transport system substrate-binding protein|nr:amino acid ABC transporter substrate-binding protein [Methylomirabilota bacterium]